MSAITLDGTELRRTDGRIRSWFEKNPFAPAQVRGEDYIIAKADGRKPRPRRKDLRVLELSQFVKGVGATEDAAWADFLSLADTLAALYASTFATPKELRIYAPIWGVASGYRSLNVRYVNALEEKPVAAHQSSTIRFECVDSPPDWIVVP